MSRILLWEKVLRQIKEIDGDFKFSRDDITRKFLNLMVTYRRIKKRNSTSGEAASTWEFFEDFDVVYGARSDVVVPESLLDSSLNTTLECLLTEENVQGGSPATPPPKRLRCEVLQILREERWADKEFMDSFLNIEKGRLKVKKEKVEEMKKLRECLMSMNTN